MIEFFHYLNAIQPLSAEAQAGLLKVVRPKELRRGQVLLQEGAVCDKIYFVIKGLLKLHFETGTKEVILQFARENEVMISVWSYFEQEPSLYTIRAVEASVILTISKPELEHLMERFPELNLHLFTIGKGQICALEDHLGLTMLPQRERYHQLHKVFPWFEGRLSDRHGAAFIGVSGNCYSNYKTGARFERRRDEKD
jgi:CRP-like cAMP-binding protein